MAKTIELNGKSYSLPDKKPELLLPAGTLEKAKYAFAFGADAVYAGLPAFSMRAKLKSFDLESMKELIDYAHEKNKKVYLTTNIYPHNAKVEPFLTLLDQLVKLNPDAFIMSDPGLIMLALERYPDLEIHLSVQQNNVNWASCKFWGNTGVKRIILARELSFYEMKTIVEKNPTIEFEAFVHGAICMAYSGRCLLSTYMTGRDANQGMCAQSCRWQYKVFKDLSSEENQDVKIRPIERKYTQPEGNYLIEEKLRPGEYMPIEEDSNGSYIMNSRDMCAIDYLEDLMDAGICSLKIEGRNKGIFYVSTVAKAYREAIDSIYDKETKADIKQLITNLQSIGNRGYIPGFHTDEVQEHSQWYEKNGMLQTHVFLGEMISYDKETQTATFNAKNQVDTGDTIELFSPNESQTVTITEMTNENDEPIKVVHPGAGCFKIKLPKQLTSPYCIARREGKQKTAKK